MAAMPFTEKPIPGFPPEPQHKDGGCFPLILEAFMTKGRKDFSRRQKGNMLAFKSSFLHKGKLISTYDIAGIGLLPQDTFRSGEKT